MKITIGTHDGLFHADDVFAVAALRRVNPGATIVRSRDSKVLETCDILVDVGGVYNSLTTRYDHHQKGGAGARWNLVPYSSFGLVWRDYGGRYCDDTEAAILVDERLVQPIDASDNGVALYDGGTIKFPGIIGMNISGVIAGFNPQTGSAQDYDDAFEVAMGCATLILDNTVRKAKFDLLGRAEIKAAARAYKGEGFVEISHGGLEWQNTFVRIDGLSYVLFPSGTGTWMVRCVPPAVGSFESKYPFPEAWRSLNDDALAEATGVEDAVFCHRTGFLCGAKSREGAMKLLKLALENAEVIHAEWIKEQEALFDSKNPPAP